MWTTSGLRPDTCASLMPPILHQAEEIERTHDYTPFVQQYVTKIYHAGFLHDLLEIDENGKPVKSSRSQT